MIEHPLPQNITAYQFHLIGNMTVKQFLILLAGVGVCIVLYSTNLFFLLKWGLIIFFFLLAAATAFVPYESRTLDQWLINFIRAIYRPTKFYWTRQLEVPGFFAFHQRSDVQRQQVQLDLTPYRQQQVRQYLSSLGTTAAPENDPLDIFSQRSGQISELFTNVQAARDVNPAEYQEVIKPELQVRARPLRPSRTVFSLGAAGSLAGAIPGGAQTPVPQPAAPMLPPVQHSTATLQRQDPAASATAEPAATQQDANASSRVAHGSRAHVSAQEILRVAPVQEQQTSLEAENGALTDIAPPSQGEAEMYADSQTASSSLSGEHVIPAVFNPDLPFPSVPDKPNLLVGMVHDVAHKIIPGAIVEILDSTGNTVRAMKTNALGQFYISSPLPNGTYHLETEKDGFQFPVYAFDATGAVLPPVDILAQSASDAPAA